MPALNEEQARAYMRKLLAATVAAGGSDLFIAKDFPPSLKVAGEMKAMTAQKLPAEVTRVLASVLMTARQREDFARELECNFALSVMGVGRFRVNVAMQQASVSLVCRAIAAEAPDIEALGLPAALRDVALAGSGLVLAVGAGGSGKSTTLAALVNHRNWNAAGHIVTVEDPVEVVHVPVKSLVTQRDVGLDTRGWRQALDNARRQSPDVLLIGEIRDAETMAHAIAFAETGHLCLATLRADSAGQAVAHVLDFFPAERRARLRAALATHLRAVVAQRLPRRADGKGRVAAVELLLNTPAVARRIATDRLDEIPGLLSRGIDQALADLVGQGTIDFEEALRQADSAQALRQRVESARLHRTE